MGGLHQWVIQQVRIRCGVVLQTPEGIKLERAVTFGFKASNNEAEYEALILGLQLAEVCGATNLIAHCDFQLVVGQVLGEFEVKEDSIRSYRALVMKLTANFQNFNLVKITGQNNFNADRLAKLAASTEVHNSQPSPICFLETPIIRCFEGVRLMNIIDAAGS